MDFPTRDSRNHRRTASLFVEATHDEQLKPVYTMTDEDKGEYKSAYQIFMRAVDEYDAAIQLVGSMVHWRKLCQCKWFMDGDIELGFTGLNDWRKDMALRDSSQAKRLVRDQMANDDLRAANLLLDIAAGKKERVQKKKAPKSSTTPRRGTQNPASVVDISAAAARIKPE